MYYNVIYIRILVYTWYTLCIYVQQCLGEGVLNFKNYCQQLLKMKLVQTKRTKPNDNVFMSQYINILLLSVVHFVITLLL